MLFGLGYSELVKNFEICKERAMNVEASSCTVQQQQQLGYIEYTIVVH